MKDDVVIENGKVSGPHWTKRFREHWHYRVGCTECGQDPEYAVTVYADRRGFYGRGDTPVKALEDLRREIAGRRDYGRAAELALRTLAEGALESAPEPDAIPEWRDPDEDAR